MTVVGVISDTHGLLRPEALACLQGSELIIHAGDIGPKDILDRLGEIAPVTAVRGNVDSDSWHANLATDEVIELNGRFIYVNHDLGELDLNPAPAGFDVVISGHSHKPGVSEKDSILYLNPGSAGPRRFSLPVSLATLLVTNSAVTASSHELEV
ncbi:MAG: metallophosphoesterase family protein [Hyphomicrobiales bacterium]|nr:metallophosphoesterase family protein [Hyphomicrobiales bacterium]MCP4997563.1 metallophosphoesterase family protein [Hyphomicrobiales bacterium]